MVLQTASRSIVANFFTSGYRVLGRVHMGNSGLIGLLNNPSTSLLDLTETTLARLHEPKIVADRCEELGLVKQGLVAIGLGREQDVGPQSVARGGFGNISRFPIRAITSSFEVDGEMEWSGRFEFRVLLSEGARDFFPIYNATLRAIEYPDLVMKSPAIILNRRKLDLFRELKEGVEGQN